MYNAVQSSDSADRLIQYIVKEDRCEYVFGVGCSVQTAMQDFADTRRRFGQEGLKVQAYAEVVSASVAEVDPTDPEAVHRFGLWAKEDVRRKYPGRQAVVGVQIDGATGLCHAHYAVCNPAHEDAEFTHMVKGRPVTEKVIAGRAMTSAGANIFRLRAATNALLADERFMESIGYDNSRLGELMKDQAGWDGKKKFDPQAGLVGKHAYDNTEVVRASRTSDQWLEDLKERIRAAVAEATGEDEFQELLETDGAVRLNVRGAKTKVYSYTFTDPSSGKTYTSRAGSKRLPGDEFSRESVLAAVEENQQQKAAEQSTPAAVPTPGTEQPERSFEEEMVALRSEQDAMAAQINADRAAAGLPEWKSKSWLRDLPRQKSANIQARINDLIAFEEEHRDAIVAGELIPDSEVPRGMTRKFLEYDVIKDRTDPEAHARLLARANMRSARKELFEQGAALKSRYKANPSGETLLDLTKSNMHRARIEKAIRSGDYRQVPKPDRLTVALAAVQEVHDRRFGSIIFDSVEDQQSKIVIRRVGEISRLPGPDRAEALERLIVDLHDENFGKAEIEARSAEQEKVSAAPAPDTRRPAAAPAPAGQQSLKRTPMQERIAAARAKQKEDNVKIREHNEEQSNDYSQGMG